MKIMVCAAVVGVLLSGCGGDDEPSASASPTPSPTASEAPAALPIPLTLAYQFTPGDGAGISRQNDEIGADCGTSGLTSPTDGLAFMKPGATITVQDGAGELIGKTTLSDAGSQTSYDPGPPIAFTCVWSATVSDVPPDRDFYSVLVDDNKVGDFTKAEFTGGSEVLVVLEP